MPYLGLSLSIVVLIAGLVLGLIAQRLCRESETRALHVAAREALGEAARRAP